MSEVVLLSIVGVGYILFSLAKVLFVRHERALSLSRALDLTPVRWGLVTFSRLTGIHQEQRVEVTHGTPTNEFGTLTKVSYALTVSPPRPFRYNLALRRGSLFSRMMSSQDIILGHPKFDEDVLVQGTWEPGVVALIDDETRDIILSLLSMGDRFEVDTKSIQVSVNSDSDSLLRLSRCLELCVKLSLRLGRAGKIEELLAQNVQSSRSFPYRRRNLQLLLTYPITDQLRQEVLEPILRDDGLILRSMVARVLGGDALKDVCTDLLHHDAPWPFEAFREVSQSQDPQILPVLHKGIEQPELVELAAEGMAIHRDRTYLSLLPKLYARLLDARKRARLLQIAAAFKDASIEPFLLQVLRQQSFDGGEPEVLLSTVVALGYCGTHTAVMPLLTLAESKVDAESRTAAQEAVARIQSRIAGASAGSVMLAPTTHGPDASQHGALSLVAESAPAGALSMAEQASTAGALTLQESGGKPLEAVKKLPTPTVLTSSQS